MLLGQRPSPGRNSAGDDIARDRRDGSRAASANTPVTPQVVAMWLCFKDDAPGKIKSYRSPLMPRHRQSAKPEDPAGVRRLCAHEPAKQIGHGRDMPLPAASRQHPAAVEFGRDRPKASRSAGPDVRDHRRQVLRMALGVLRDDARSDAPPLPARRIAAMPLGLPSFTPRAFATASASLVRFEIASRSCCATRAMIPTVRSFASGISTAANLEGGIPGQPIELGDHQRRPVTFARCSAFRAPAGRGSFRFDLGETRDQRARSGRRSRRSPAAAPRSRARSRLGGTSTPAHSR